MKKALITGALGQDGTYLTEHLLSLGYHVFAMIRKSPIASSPALAYLAEKTAENRVNFIYGDVRDEQSLRSAIRKSWPDEIYNLAGQVFVPVSWEFPEETINVNAGGLARILKIVEEVKRDTRVYQASTSEMFGNHPGTCTDETEMYPTSPYGVSKLTAHALAGLYRTRGLYVVSGILFNHESPRRGSEMVTMKIARTVASWSLGSKETLSLGNMDSRRDWGFAGDYVKAMHLMLQPEDPSDYVVGTGVSHSVEDFLQMACLKGGVSYKFCQDHLEIDGRLQRVQEIHDMRADNAKVSALGWKPSILFHDLVDLMVRSEQQRLKAKPPEVKHEVSRSA